MFLAASPIYRLCTGDKGSTCAAEQDKVTKQVRVMTHGRMCLNKTPLQFCGFNYAAGSNLSEWTEPVQVICVRFDDGPDGNM